MAEPWIERWQTGRTGWHEAEGNASLKLHWQLAGRRVLVPLCGKSVDLLWLEAQGNEVFGVELSPIAVEAFFDEHELAYERRSGDLVVYTATERRITIACGDFFALTGEYFDAHYDRGALIALPPEMRRRYAAHTSSLLGSNAAQLVVTVEYDQQHAAGPPYSVGEQEVLSYWSGLEKVESREDIGNAPPKFLEAGLESMHEVVWRSR
jgi:thiopurine S-methyltransferase